MAKTYAKKYTKEIARYQKTHPEYKVVQLKNGRTREIGMTDEMLREALNYRQYKIDTTGRAPKKTEKELLRALRKDPYAQIGMHASSFTKDIGTLKSKTVQMSIAKDFLSIGEKKEKVYESVQKFVKAYETKGFSKYEAFDAYRAGVKKYGANFIKSAAYQPTHSANWAFDILKGTEGSGAGGEDPRLEQIMRLWHNYLTNRVSDGEYKETKAKAIRLCETYPDDSAEGIFERLIGGDVEKFNYDFDDPEDMPF